MSKKIDVKMKAPPKPEIATTKEHEKSRNRDFDAELKGEIIENILSSFTKNFFKWAWGSLIIFLVILFLVILPIREIDLMYFQCKPFSFFMVLRFIQKWAVAFVDSSRTVGVGILALVVSDALKRFIYRKEW